MRWAKGILLGFAVATAACSPVSPPATPTLPATPIAPPVSSAARPTTAPAPSVWAPGGAESPEIAVQGALVSSVEMEVAPATYRSGRISDGLAQAWLDRVEPEYRRWYAESVRYQMLAGLHNVVDSHRSAEAPIVVSVDITGMLVPPAQVSGDEATVGEAGIHGMATIAYIRHFAPGTWVPTDLPGSTGCFFTLHRYSDGWRVVDQSCNVSGG